MKENSGNFISIQRNAGREKHSNPAQRRSFVLRGKSAIMDPKSAQGGDLSAGLHHLEKRQDLTLALNRPPISRFAGRPSTLVFLYPFDFTAAPSNP